MKSLRYLAETFFWAVCLAVVVAFEAARDAVLELVAWIRLEVSRTPARALALALVAVAATWTYAAAATWRNYGASFRAKSLAADGSIYDTYSSTTGLGQKARRFTTTLSSGTKAYSFGADVFPQVCVGNTVGTVGRTYAIVFDSAVAPGSTTRTFTISLGGGGTTNNTVNGVCWTEETASAGS